jgi:hypothetical protein
MESVGFRDLSFEYLQATPANKEIEGIFVFSFYVSEDSVNVKTNPYLQGISMYVDALEKDGGVFKNWKILLYTDKKSYLLVKDIFVEKPVDFCIVTWPYYTDEKNTVHGGVLRVMRFRSFFDFSSIPVFVRDADTIFADIHNSKRYIHTTSEKLYNWEADFLTGAKEHPNTWIFGTSLLYYLPHHKNKEKGQYTPLGAFAGFQSIIPTVPCFQSEKIWDESITYILEDTKRNVTNGLVTFSNKNNFHKRVGKDERILSFIFLNRCDYKNIFFFEVDMAGFRRLDLKGKLLANDDYPSFILQRGSNSKIHDILEQAKKNEFKINRSNSIKQQRIQIETNLRTFNRTRNSALRNFLKGFVNKNIEFTKPQYYNSGILFFYSLIRHVYDRVSGLLTNSQDTELKEVYEDFLRKYTTYQETKEVIRKKLAYTNQVSLSDKEREAYQTIVREKDDAAKKFVDTVLQFVKKEEILKKVVNSSIEDVAILLDFKGRPPPPAPKATSLFKMMQVAAQKVKGGSKTKKIKRNKQHTKY